MLRVAASRVCEEDGGYAGCIREVVAIRMLQVDRHIDEVCCAADERQRVSILP